MGRFGLATLVLVCFSATAQADMTGIFRGNIEYSSVQQNGGESCFIENAVLQILVEDSNFMFSLEANCNGHMIYQNEVFELDGSTVSYAGAVCGVFSDTEMHCRDEHGGQTTWEFVRNGDILDFTFSAVADPDGIAQDGMKGRFLVQIALEEPGSQ